VEKEMVVKTYSKESASSKIQWNKRHEQDEQLQNFRELAVIPNPTRDTHRTGEIIIPKNLHHRHNDPVIGAPWRGIFHFFSYGSITRHIITVSSIFIIWFF
jgi:hypothetical protein